jgi:hypothetical protein
MPLSFPETGDSDAVVGQTPWSTRVPLDPLLCNEISLIESQRADQGVGCGPGGTAPQTERAERIPGQLSGIGMASCARLPTAQSAPHGNGLKRHLEPRWIQSPNAMPCCRMAQKLPAGFAYAYRTTPAIFGTVCQSVIRNCLSRCSRWFLAPSALVKNRSLLFGSKILATCGYQLSTLRNGQRSEN